MYRTYKYRGRDPVLGEIKTMFLSANLKKVELARMSGVSASTIYNHLGGKTRMPRNDTIEAQGRALGYQRKWVMHNRKEWVTYNRRGGNG